MVCGWQQLLLPPARVLCPEKLLGFLDVGELSTTSCGKVAKVDLFGGFLPGFL